MPHQYPRTRAAYLALMQSSLFRLDGKPPAPSLPEALSALALAVREETEDARAAGEETESLWWMECGGEASLADLIIGAFWALTEWHAGQNSPEYAALSALGRVYSPGMECAPEEGEPARAAYEIIGAYFQARAPR